MHAYCLIREQPHYRSDAFIAGLKAAGYKVTTGMPPRGTAADVLVIWNRYGTNEMAADAFEKQGGTVLVAENGYIGKDAEGRQLYALAKHGHNGSGTWPDGDGARFAQLGIELKPWRQDGEHILVCGQRGIGSRLMASPPGWHDAMANKLRRVTKRPVRIRTHPGTDKTAKPLAEDLAGAYAVVIWSSGSGVKALAEGIPVIKCAPYWICESAAAASLQSIEIDRAPRTPDHLPNIDAPIDGFWNARLPAFERMAWAQWTVEEIASGKPFAALLPAAG